MNVAIAVLPPELPLSLLAATSSLFLVAISNVTGGLLEDWLAGGVRQLVQLWLTDRLLAAC